MAGRPEARCLGRVITRQSWAPETPVPVSVASICFQVLPSTPRGISCSRWTGEIGTPAWSQARKAPREGATGDRVISASGNTVP